MEEEGEDTYVLLHLHLHGVIDRNPLLFVVVVVVVKRRRKEGGEGEGYCKASRRIVR
jgi:hypothetical protein